MLLIKQKTIRGYGKKHRQLNAMFRGMVACIEVEADSKRQIILVDAASNALAKTDELNKKIGILTRKLFRFYQVNRPMRKAAGCLFMNGLFQTIIFSILY